MGNTPSLVGLSQDQVALVRQNMLNSSTQSWELGTATEALLELEWPTLSVFGGNPIPPPLQLESWNNASDVLSIANWVIDNLPNDTLALMDDDSIGDPASLGNSVLLANWTRLDTSNSAYAEAAGNQLDYLLNLAPRTDDGAISHRADQVQLWSDFVYMAPPFIAYFGALQTTDLDGARALLTVAYDQCRLYRDYLLDSDTGLWRHITLGDWQDDTLWATGNGWAAAGMLRVLQTLKVSMLSSEFQSQQDDLTEWIYEIIGGAWSFQADNGTLLNAINDLTSFPDSSGTALLAAVTYRLSYMNGDPTYVDAATKAFTLVKKNLSVDGWLQDVVDPLTFNTAGTTSPEGQAFVLLLESAWRDYFNVFLNGS